MTWAVIDTILVSVGGNWWIFLLQILLVIAVIWVLFHKTSQENERNELTEEELDKRIQEILQEWEPDDLVPSKFIKEAIMDPKIISGKAEKYITVNGDLLLNISTMNFLDLVGDYKIEEEAINAIGRYGVGSCGPRGFYGTVDAHLDLEEGLAKFMGTEEAIVYSHGFSCIASAIPAYAKRHDVIFADEKVNFAIQRGLFASRSTVKYFQHNNPNDLEVLLKNYELEAKLVPSKAAKTRKFVIIEGIYMNTGELVDLPRYTALRKKYKFRLFIDESISFGTVCNGRGVTKYYDINMDDVDMIMGTLEFAVGSVGGFCCGRKFIIEHQRLSGLGYCFSASQPPLHAVGALRAIDIIKENENMLLELKTACILMDKSLRRLRGMKLTGWPESPVKHLYLCSSHIADVAQEETLQSIINYCYRHGIAVVSPAYIDKEETFKPTPSLRICVNRTLQPAEIVKVVAVLQSALNEIEFNQQGISTDGEACIKNK